MKRHRVRAMEGSKPCGSRKRKRRENPKLIVLALEAPSISLPRPPPLHTTTNINGTVKAGLTPTGLSKPRRGRKRKQEAAPEDQQQHEHEHENKKRKQEALPQDQQEHEHERENKKRFRVVRIRVLDPGATDSSSDEENLKADGNKRRKVEIVHKIRIPIVQEKIPCCSSSSPTKEINLSESQTQTRKRSKRRMKDSSKKKVEIGSNNKVVEKDESSSKNMVLYEVPGPIPDLQKLVEEEGNKLLINFFDGVPSGCSDDD